MHMAGCTHQGVHTCANTIYGKSADQNCSMGYRAKGILRPRSVMPFTP